MNLILNLDTVQIHPLPCGEHLERDRSVLKLQLALSLQEKVRSVGEILHVPFLAQFTQMILC